MVILVFGGWFLRRPQLGYLLFLTTSLWAGAAGVERLEIIKREPFQNGISFGSVGPYEMVQGLVHYTLKPGSENIVSDLAWAEVDKDGLIRYSSDFYLVKPVDSKRGNGSLLIDLPNRGTVLGFSLNIPFYPMGLSKFSLAGDGFVFRRGFTLFGVGWQSDSPKGFPNKLRLHPPAVMSSPKIRGLVRSEFIVTDDGVKTMPLGHWSHEAYPVLISGKTHSLTVRDSPYGKRNVICPDDWAFATWENGRLKKDLYHISLRNGFFEKGRIYDAVYTTDKPKFVGLGLTAVRDIVSYLRYDKNSPVSIQRTIGFGASQSGRFLRHFLYYGLNQDDQSRMVIDGFLASVSGAGRGGFNHRFAQPSRFASSYFGIDYPTDIFPFSDIAQVDVFSNQRDGLRPENIGGAKIKIIYLNTGHEYWGRAASLIHTTPNGEKDIAIHENTRYYHIASASHLPADMPPTRNLSKKAHYRMIGKNLGNPSNYFWCERALIGALDDWVANRKDPPHSRFPTIEGGTLVKPEMYNFPKILNAETPKKAYSPRLLDYGPHFLDQGIVAKQPPMAEKDKTYLTLVPKADRDGNELGGLRLPEIVVPVGSFTPWNWRAPEIGAPTQPADLAGSFFPFYSELAHLHIAFVTDNL